MNYSEVLAEKQRVNAVVQQTADAWSAYSAQGDSDYDSITTQWNAFVDAWNSFAQNGVEAWSFLGWSPQDTTETSQIIALENQLNNLQAQMIQWESSNNLSSNINANTTPPTADNPPFGLPSTTTLIYVGTGLAALYLFGPFIRSTLGVGARIEDRVARPRYY